jgi:hypothetical protein
MFELIVGIIATIVVGILGVLIGNKIKHKEIIEIKKINVNQNINGWFFNIYIRNKVNVISQIKSVSVQINELLSFASSLKAYGENNSYHDICNLADALSGEAAKTRYLLTLS